MKKLKIALASFALIAFAGIAIGQSGQGYWPSLPVVGGASYCASTTNGVCHSTIPAGPTALTGNEGIPANTNLSGGRSPQNVLVTPAALGALPLSFATVTTVAPTTVAAVTDGGIIYTSAATITSANVTLPAGAINGQIYAINSNRTITTLTVAAASGDSINTVLTASTTAPQGYRFVCDKSSGVCVWKRLL